MDARRITAPAALSAANQHAKRTHADSGWSTVDHEVGGSVATTAERWATAQRLEKFGADLGSN